MRFITNRRRAIIGLLTAIALVFSLTGCHDPGHVITDKTRATVESTTTHPNDGNNYGVDVKVTNKTNAYMTAIIDVEDCSGTARPNYHMSLAPNSSQVESWSDIRTTCVGQNNVDIWVKICNFSSDPNCTAVEWHNHENIQWDPDPATPGWG